VDDEEHRAFHGRELRDEDLVEAGCRVPHVTPPTI
jgi:hypothetical protein